MHKKLQIVFPVLALCLGMFTYHSFQSSNMYDVETVTGDKFSWHDKQGSWLVVNFFAQWCAPCLREIPELNDFSENWKEEIPLYMVSFDLLDRQALTNIIQQHNIKVPVIMRTQNTRLPMPLPAGLPATYIISPQGDVKDVLMGEVTKKTLKSAIEKAKNA